MAEDIFDTALNIEDTSYNEGYTLGHTDGSQAGLLEGRAFGLQKGYEKFFEMGKLHGRACVWGARLVPVTVAGPAGSSAAAAAAAEEEALKITDQRAAADGGKRIPEIAANARLEKHVRTLIALTEAEQVSTTNEEDVVADVDDRIKRAVAKAKVIERIVGEQHDVRVTSTGTTGTVHESGNVVGGSGSNRVASQVAGQGHDVRLANVPLAERNIEDFVGGANVRTG